jgi:hypothetical protein
MPLLNRLRSGPALALGAVLLSLLGACALTSKKADRVPVYQREGFESNETYSRLFDASAADTCEAARRALLSQGYLINTARPDLINATKAFQPEGEVHVTITFNVVCTSDGASGKISTAFANAIQDRYTLKKNANSASVGLSAIGSVSIPMGSSDDSLVKVASETIPAGQFYDRFFALLQRFVQDQAISTPSAAGASTPSS